MKEFDFYRYFEDEDKIKIYSEDISNHFEKYYNIIIDSIDFNYEQNVVLYIEGLKNNIIPSELEKKLLDEIEHLNDVEVRNMKIILIFDCKEIELC